jgi:Putative zinc-finger
MDCEKARDRFSSLWERELTPFEERVVKEHLSSCPECQREFDQFEKAMRWLHSVEEVEVPDEFLPELYKKMEERERIISAKKPRGGWFNLPLPFKLPVQAAAMVAVVFLVLYLTKMMPIGGYHPKETGQPSSPLSVEKKSEQVLAQKEMERVPRALETTPLAPRTKNVEQAEAPAPGEEKLKGAFSPQVEAKAKKAEIPSSKTTAMGYRTVDSKEAARARTSSSEPEEIGKGLISKEESAMAPKPPQEIVLKISDREKAILQVQELVKQFGGEMLTTKGNGFLASLPKNSFSDFKKELEGVSSTSKTDEGIMRKQNAGGLKALHGVEKEAVEGKSGEPAKPVTDEESRIVVRILLVQE